MDNTLILCWNVRGLNSTARRDNVRTLVQDLNPHIVCLVETKLDSVPPMLVSSMLGMNFVDYAFLPAAGTRGGILIAAREPDIWLSDITIGCYSATVAVRTAPPGQADIPWWLSTVYGPQSDGEKKLFLEELAAIRDACDGPWILLGDFNLILEEEDKNNGRINRWNLARFRETVTSLELMDIPLHGRRYTWSNERNNPTLVRLDRVLASMDWEDRFHNCHLQALGSDASDHCPLLLRTNLSLYSKPRFHFEIFWPRMVGYQEVLQQGWACSDAITDPLRRLDAKFRNLSRELHSWSARRIGNVREQLLMAREIIFKLDQAGDHRQLTVEETELRRELKLKCLGLSSLERTIAR